MVKELIIHNFKNVPDGHHYFEGGVYIFSGENDIGKSHSLEAIERLLSGDITGPMLKKGAKDGFIKQVHETADGNYEIEIKFEQEKPAKLIITGPGGIKTDKVTMLRSMLKYKSFDPNQFILWGDNTDGRKKQADLIKSLIDEETINKMNLNRQNRQMMYDSRTMINKDVTFHKGKMDENDEARKLMVELEDVINDDKRKTAKELREEKEKAVEDNNKIEVTKTGLDGLKTQLTNWDLETDKQAKAHKTTKEALDKELEELQAKIKAHADTMKNHGAERNKGRADLDKRIKTGDKWMEENQPVNIEEINARISTAESIEENLQMIKDYKEHKEKHEAAEKQSKEHTEKIEEFDDEYKKLIASSKLPVDGLEFSDDGLFLNGIPFQAKEVSTSDKINVAMRIAMAINQTTRIFIMQNGESMGEAKLEALVQWAQENGFQGFVEEMRRGQDDLLIEKYDIS